MQIQVSHISYNINLKDIFYNPSNPAYSAVISIYSPDLKIKNTNTLPKSSQENRVKPVVPLKQALMQSDIYRKVGDLVVKRLELSGLELNILI